MEIIKQKKTKINKNFFLYKVYTEMLDILNQPLLDTHDTALYNTLMDFDRKRKLDSKEVFPELYEEKIWKYFTWALYLIKQDFADGAQAEQRRMKREFNNLKLSECDSVEHFLSKMDRLENAITLDPPSEHDKLDMLTFNLLDRDDIRYDYNIFIKIWWWE
mgnify:CR=1 FL=1